MDALGNSRNSTNFIQSNMDDGSLDFYADWDEFSFKDEINARTNILEEDLKAYYQLLGQNSIDDCSTIEEAVIESQSKTVLYDEFYIKLQNFVSKYESISKEQNKIKEELKNLNMKNVLLLNEIIKLQKEKSTSRIEYKQLKLSLQKAVAMYTTYFGFKVSTEALSDTTYEASVFFKVKGEVGPFKFIIDRSTRKLMGFQLNQVLSSKEEEALKKEFGDLKNLPGLFCALRAIATEK